MSRERELSDCSHEYLVERVLAGEQYMNEIVQMLGQFHPYLQPAFSAIAEDAMRRSDALEAKYPVSGLILPPKKFNS